MPTDKITPVQMRLIQTHADILGDVQPEDLSFQHAAFCQCSLPYRAGKDKRAWHRKVGDITLHIQAGYAPLSPGEDLQPVPLPSGPRARLVLIYMMSQAVIQQSPRVELDTSLTAFVESLGIHTNGRNIRAMRDQLRRLSTATFRVMTDYRETNYGLSEVKRSHMTQGHLVNSFEVWSPKSARQRVFWPSYVELNPQFFESLCKHAVPLDPRALAALKHSSSSLDTYQWLAQRLYRVNGVAKIKWKTLHTQLGGGTSDRFAWKQEWLGKRDGILGTLPQVLQVYPAAAEAVEVTDEHLVLRQAAPPIPRRLGKTRR